MPTVRLPLEQIEWQAVGDIVGADDPRHQLQASITCGGCNLHVTAIEVHVDGHGIQAAVDASGETWLEGLAQLTGAFDILETVSIEGREYVLAITPHAS